MQANAAVILANKHFIRAAEEMELCRVGCKRCYQAAVSINFHVWLARAFPCIIPAVDSDGYLRAGHFNRAIVGFACLYFEVRNIVELPLINGAGLINACYGTESRMSRVEELSMRWPQPEPAAAGKERLLVSSACYLRQG